MTAVEAVRDALEEMISVVPDDAGELLDLIEQRGFILVPVGKNAEHGKSE